MTSRSAGAIGLLLALLVPPTAPRADEPSEMELDEVVIVGVTPVPGLGQPLDRVPANVQQTGAADVERRAPLGLADLLGRRIAGVHLAETQGSPYQPDVTYRGFLSSPVLGTPQGISVFQDGTRLNELLGDTMNWDLVPQDAIASLQVAPGADPLYGRNTLGSAVAIQTKRGRTHPGSAAEVSWGSFARRRLLAETGGQRGDVDYFLLGNFFREDGFRDFSDSDVNQFFGQLGWRDAASDVSVTYTGARNEIRGNGLVPESFLAEDRSAVFTHPDVFEPDLDFVNLLAQRAFGPRWRADASLHYRRLETRQFTADEQAERTGDGEEPGGVNRESFTNQQRFGGAGQVAWTEYLAGLENSLAVGIDFDRGDGDLRFFEQEGSLDTRRTVVPTGPFRLAADVETTVDAFGVFLTDTFTPRPWLSLTLSTRYDRSRVEIDDRFEGDASGEHVFDRLNPAIGLTLRPGPRAQIFARYGEGFRAPTAIELACSAADDPCALPIAFAEDPPLDAVRARSVEVGVRAGPIAAVRAALAFFRTELRDDILFVSPTRAAGFFRNVERTRRQGAELLFDGRTAAADWTASYTFTRATFETAETLPSPIENNEVRPGDAIPGVPDHLAKLALDLPPIRGVRLGVDTEYASEQILRTDEANRRPRLDGYVVVNAQLAYTRGPFTLFARARNLFDATYETFGSQGENIFRGGAVERFLSPGAPRGGWFGLRIDL